MNYCPWCHVSRNNGHAYEQGDTPQKGDVSICWSCRQIGIYDDETTVRIPTREEYESAMQNSEVRKVLYLTHEMPSVASVLEQWRSS